MTLPQDISNLQSEMRAAVREHGFERIDDVWSAVLEVDGSISVIARDDNHRSHQRALPPA